MSQALTLPMTGSYSTVSQVLLYFMHWFPCRTFVQLNTTLLFAEPAPVAGP